MPSPETRARALRDAGDLFYAEGINATGVNRVAAKLGMSKRTLYELFDDKDTLVTEALASRDAEIREALTDAAAASDDPAEQLVALLDVAEQWTQRPGFRGCPYLNAAAELADPEHPVHGVVRDHKESLRRWIESRARRAGLQRPRAVSHELMLLLDGTLSQAAGGMLRPGVAARVARAVVDGARR